MVGQGKYSHFYWKTLSQEFIRPTNGRAGKSSLSYWKTQVNDLSDQPMAGQGKYSLFYWKTLSQGFIRPTNGRAGKVFAFLLENITQRFIRPNQPMAGQENVLPFLISQHKLSSQLSRKSAHLERKSRKV